MLYAYLNLQFKNILCLNGKFLDYMDTHIYLMSRVNFDKVEYFFYLGFCELPYTNI